MYDITVTPCVVDLVKGKEVWSESCLFFVLFCFLFFVVFFVFNLCSRVCHHVCVQTFLA